MWPARDKRQIWHVWGIVELHTWFWRRDFMERDHLEDLGVDGEIIARWIFKNWDGEA